MYKKELDIKLAKNTEISAIFLYGADRFLIGYYGEKIAKKFLEQGMKKMAFILENLIFKMC